MSRYIYSAGLNGWGVPNPVAVAEKIAGKVTNSASGEQAAAIAQSTAESSKHQKQTKERQQKTRESRAQEEVFIPLPSVTTDNRDGRLTITGTTGKNGPKVTRAPVLKKTPGGGVMVDTIPVPAERELPMAAKAALGAGAVGLFVLGIRALR